MNKPNFNKNSSAQGTIEYLVIIAIVVVISLVVVALLLGVFENNSDVSSTAQSISTQTLPVALNEAILGTGVDANGLIVLTNNTGDVIRDVRVSIDGKDHNYFGINLAQGNKATFKLDTLQVPCPSGQDTTIKTITITYTTRNGLEKTQKIENISLQCAQTPSPVATINPIQENQPGQTPITPPQSDTTPPTVVFDFPDDDYLISSLDGLNNFDFEYTPSDNVGVSDCNLIIDSVFVEQNDDITSGSSTFFTTNISELENGDHSWNIICTDTSGNTSTNNDFNFSVHIGPVVSINSPENETDFTYGDNIDVGFTATDDKAGMDCNLLIDGEIVDYTHTALSTITTTLSYATDEQGAEIGEHEYYIWCKDSENNVGVSETQILTINASTPVSCKDIIDTNPSATSGVYTIKPVGVATAFSAYCDMTTDGGGWTLVMNYNHAGGTSPTKISRDNNLPLLSLNSVGTNESGTQYWGEASPTLLNKFSFTRLRYEGQNTPACGSRKINMYTENSTFLNFVKTGSGTLSNSTSYFTRYADHNAKVFNTSTTTCTDQSWLNSISTTKALSRYGNHACGSYCYYTGDPSGTGYAWAVDNLDNDGCGTNGGYGGNKSMQIKAWIR